MALAIDPSTPQLDNISMTGTSFTTTHLFSPPANSVIFVFITCVGPASGSQTVTSMSDSLGGHLSWALFTGSRDNVTVSSLTGDTEVWWAACPTAQTNMSVTVNLAVANDSAGSDPAGIIQPVVFTGAAPIQNGNATIRNSGTAATPSQTLTTSVNNSWVFGVIQNWSNSTGATAGSSQTNTINGNSAIVTNVSDADAFWVQAATATTATSGTVVTLNDTAPTTIKHHFSMVEVVPVNSGIAPTFVASYKTSFTGNTSPLTVSVTTQAGDLLVVYGGTEDTATSITSPPSGNGITFTQQQGWTTASYSSAFLWTGVDANGGTNWTMSASITGSAFWGYNCLVFRGAGLGASAIGNSAIGTPSLTFSTTKDNSMIVVYSSDWFSVNNSTRTWLTVNGITPTSGNGLELSSDWISGHYSEYGAYYSNAGTAGSNTVGLSAPSGQKYAIVALEVIGVPPNGATTSWFKA